MIVMENNHTLDGKHPLSELLRDTMDQVHAMVDTNAIVGEPITTPDGVTLIPISKVSFGFGGGGGEYGKTAPKENFGGGTGGGVKIDPVAFLVLKEGTARVLPVAIPASTAADRIVEMVPDLLDKMEKYFDRKQEKETP